MSFQVPEEGYLVLENFSMSLPAGPISYHPWLTKIPGVFVCLFCNFLTLFYLFYFPPTSFPSLSLLFSSFSAAFSGA